ncbi:class I SAM-dependent methyltransferase [Primorskyibacter aestuariivivens]|uniref:class I SAM-dependent methyltransferase n=1 Tax=Primorskyibacter aestuariivivens TaxID=1888912 RepID=UPI002301C3F8|nr:class I SAM-dependent methyltransferase [Primorskyibacter aestuariivivens]MDA7429878.1 class I SAM-dependent methyltransferase [Primorskyibacter aestuariivivens]
MHSFAENYDAVLVPVIFQPWARELIRKATPWDGVHFLDLACGTGAVTREVAATGIKATALTGVDMTAGMLEVARQRAREAGLDVELIKATADDLPFEDDRFDLAYCQQALQFFPDKVRALAELRRVMAGGAPVAFCMTTELEENPLLQAQSAAMDRHVGQKAGDAVRAICSLSDGQTIRALFEQAGFNSIDIEKVTLTLHHPDARAYAEGAMGGMHTGDKLAGLDRDQREACMDDFLTGLGACFDGQAMTFPHVSHVVTARA